MTTIDPARASVEVVDATVVETTRWDRIDALLAKLGDRLNPILVKEARQALRSRQFLITFFLMLIAGWAWSIVGLARIGPAVYYSAEGPRMLFVYHLILSFPLLVVAPYAAFHSLSSERQDRTFELLSITSLGARQILTGKLCAIGLQMVVYLSAIVPCLAFTYLLRGLDIVTIVLVVVYTCAFSLALSVSGLLLGAISPLRQRHIALSVLLAIGLFGAMWVDNLWTAAIVFQGGFWGASEFWLLQGLFATLFINYFAVAFLAARSQLLTVSENRSTALRWSLVVAQLSFLGWMAGLQMTVVDPDVSFALIYVSAIGWFVFGMFLTGEPAALSPRVRRDLPQSTLARTLLTWFTPGPGTGYVFVLVNMAAISLLALLPYHEIGVFIRRLSDAAYSPSPGLWLGAGAPKPAEMMIAGAVATCYLAIYLGIGSLLVRVLRRRANLALGVPALINIVLLSVGSIVPWVIQMTSPTLRNRDWTVLQIPNAVWSLTDVCFDRLPVDDMVLLLMLFPVAVLVGGINVLFLLDDLKQVRVARPERVEQDDTALAAVGAEPPGPKDPWDEVGGGAT